MDLRTTDAVEAGRGLLATIAGALGERRAALECLTLLVDVVLPDIWLPLHDDGAAGAGALPALRQLNLGRPERIDGPARMLAALAARSHHHPEAHHLEVRWIVDHGRLRGIDIDRVNELREGAAEAGVELEVVGPGLKWGRRGRLVGMDFTPLLLFCVARVSEHRLQLTVQKWDGREAV